MWLGKAGESEGDGGAFCIQQLGYPCRYGDEAIYGLISYGLCGLCFHYVFVSAFKGVLFVTYIISTCLVSWFLSWWLRSSLSCYICIISLHLCRKKTGVGKYGEDGDIFEWVTVA